jgi:hypothetical protein
MFGVAAGMAEHGCGALGKLGHDARDFGQQFAGKKAYGPNPPGQMIARLGMEVTRWRQTAQCRVPAARNSTYENVARPGSCDTDIFFALSRFALRGPESFDGPQPSLKNCAATRVM